MNTLELETLKTTGSANIEDIIDVSYVIRVALSCVTAEKWRDMTDKDFDILSEAFNNINELINNLKKMLPKNEL